MHKVNILAFLSISLLLSRAGAQNLNGTALRLKPSTIPTYCTIGDIRVDSSGYALRFCGLTNTWSPLSGALINPMTTDGDMIYQGAGTSQRLAIGAANRVLTSDGSMPQWGLLTNSNINAGAGIVYSKLNLTSAIVNADVGNAAAIVYSKLNLTGAILNADLAGSIADSKLSTISTALKVSNSATTATSANTNSAIVARDGSGNFSTGTITAALTGNVTGNVTGSSGSTTGNAATATALAANPTDCGANTKATAIDASGNLTCSSVANADLAGSIAASKLIGSDIATVGTITSGTWNGTPLVIAYGGTNNSSLAVTAGGTLYTDGSKIVNVGAGTSGQVLQSNAASAPTWATLAAKTTGEVFMTAATTCPTGTIAADGTSLLRSGGTSCGGGACAILFAAISTTYGTVDGTHFTLPDTRGVFPRGQGTQTISSISYVGTQGTTQGDQMQGHIHTFTVYQNIVGGAGNPRADTTTATPNSPNTSNPLSDGSNGTPRTGSETRPANITLKYCIVY